MNAEKTVCVKIAGCGENQISVAGKCECLEGFFWTLGSDACVASDKCGEHQEGKTDTGKCGCVEDHQMNAAGNGCVKIANCSDT